MGKKIIYTHAKRPVIPKDHRSFSFYSDIITESERKLFSIS